MRRIRTGFRLLRQSSRVVRDEPKLMGVMVLGLITQLAFFAVIFFTVFGRAPQGEDFRWPGFLWVFPILFLSGIPGSLAGATLIAGAMQKLDGRGLDLPEAWRLALNHLPQILLFNLLAAGVGVLMQFIAERLKLGGPIAAAVVGASWTVVTLLVIPVILFEERGAFSAIKRSGSLIKERWGEGVAGHGAVAGALALVVMPLMIAGGVLIPFNPALGITVMVGTMLMLLTVSGALGGVFNAALYRYAADGTVVGGFQREQLEGAFTSKADRAQQSRARKILATRGSSCWWPICCFGTNIFWVSGIEFATAKIGYAIGKGGGAWRTEDGGQTWTSEPSSQSVWGVGVGDIAVGDTEHAIGGGPNSIIARLP